MELITVFTPTYNRRELLGRLYNSLLNQTDYGFIWMVIDDGSTDGTNDYINGLIKDTTEFRIEYYYKENGGLHTGYNLAINKLKTELCLCCDSDDWLPTNCIELIRGTWEKYKRVDCAGIIGLDCLQNGEIVGKPLQDSTYIDLNDLWIKGKLCGDKKVVVRSELYQQQEPMRTINNEKNFNPNYYNVKISENYCWIALNENLCYVEYQEAGMANNIYRQYFNSFKMRHLIHYEAECLIAQRKKDILSSGQNKVISVLVFPIAYALYVHIRYKAKQQ